MLRAHWQGYEIDSSEAAYEIDIPRPEELGTSVRSLLSSGYFVRSYVLVNEEGMVRLRDFIAQRGEEHDKLEGKALEYLNGRIAKFNDRRYTTIGVRAIESILNYVGTHRKAILDAGVFRFEPTEEQQEMYEEYEYEFEMGQKIDESDFYSEEEIPWDGVVLFLGCGLVGLDKLPPDERPAAVRAIKDSVRGMGVFDRGFIREMGGWEGILARDFDHPQTISLRVRLNPDATFGITGRWRDDGQFAYGYYEYVLERAAEKVGVEIDCYMIG